MLPAGNTMQLVQVSGMQMCLWVTVKELHEHLGGPVTHPLGLNPHVGESTYAPYATWHTARCKQATPSLLASFGTRLGFAKLGSGGPHGIHVDLVTRAFH